MARTSKKYASENTMLYFWQKIKAKLGTKVDKVEGKGLSTNDLTNELLAMIQNAATEQDIQDAITALINQSPAALDTLKELADALGNDPNFATTMTNALANKLESSDLVEITNAEIDTIVAS